MPKRRKAGGANVSFFAFQDIITAVSGILILIVIFLILMLEQPGLMNVPVEQSNDLTIGDLDDLIRDAKKRIREFEVQKLEIVGMTESNLRAEIGELQAEMESEESAEAKTLRSRLEALRTEVEKAEQQTADLETEHNQALGVVEQVQGRIDAKADDLAKAKKVPQIWLEPGAVDRKPVVIIVEKNGAIVKNFSGDGQSRNVTARDFRSVLAETDRNSSYLLFFIRPSGVRPFRTMANLALDEGYRISHRALDEKTEIHLIDSMGGLAP